MTDVLTKEQRSYNMSMIRGKWTKQERRVHNWLKAKKIKHRMHTDLPGKPDILLQESKTVIFLDGCFWHKCPKCFTKPMTNAIFWMQKINRNTENDRKNSIKLRKMGYKVVRIWEHDIRNRKASINRIFKNRIQ